MAGVSHDRLVGTRTLELARWIAGGPNGLMRDPRPEDASGLPLELARLLAGRELGTWALGTRSLRYLLAEVESSRPRLVFEFGSGASTLCLAWALRRAAIVEPAPTLIAFEQDPDHARATRTLLEEAGLSPWVSVLDAPLAHQAIAGVAMEGHQLPDDLREVLVSRKADLVVIDGPAGPAGVRFGTLPSVLDHLSAGARFVLDDAFRDGELDIIRRWQALPGVRIDGVIDIDHGLAIGSVASA
jgi:predicted O-methyltransferase YrrM